MAPANAHQAQSHEPLTPEAAKFAQGLHQKAPTAAGAGPPDVGQGLGASLGFSAADLHTAAQNLASFADTGHGVGASLGFSTSQLRIAAQNLATMGSAGLDRGKRRHESR